MNADLFRIFIKIHHAVHDAVVGNCRAFHSELLHTVKVVPDTVGTVQKAKFRVGMKMRK